MKKALGMLVMMVLCLFPLEMALGMEAVPLEKLKPGFLYFGPLGDGGWTFMHEKGRLEMEEAFPGLKSVIAEGVLEGSDSVRVMNAFIRNGSRLIFATSFGCMDSVQEVAERHENVYFMHCSGYKRRENVGTYFGRMYQARYLAGLVAGSMTKSNVLGYVGAHPFPEVIQEINGFVLGVRKANPQARVKVVWLFSWFDPGKEREAARALLDVGADVLAMHADSGAIPQIAEEAGVYVVGYNNDMSRYAPTKHLTSAIWNWGKIYIYTVNSIVEGTWKSENIWWGLREKVVQLAPFGKDVPDSVKELVAAEEEKILSGTWDVFAGPLRDQKGILRVPEGKSMPDEDILSMNWFVEGVDGEIPE